MYRAQSLDGYPGLDKVDTFRYSDIIFVGKQCFLRCSSCSRNIRMEKMNLHWDEIHSPVLCPTCNLEIDGHHAYQHMTKLCLARIAYCRFCSFETTKGNIVKHEDSCEHSPFVRGKVMEEIGIPRHVQVKIPCYERVLQTAQVYSRAHRKNYGPSAAFKVSQKMQQDFPSVCHAKRFGTLATIVEETEDELLEERLFPEGRIARARNAIDNFILEERAKLKTSYGLSSDLHDRSVVTQKRGDKKKLANNFLKVSQGDSIPVDAKIYFSQLSSKRSGRGWSQYGAKNSASVTTNTTNTYPGALAEEGVTQKEKDTSAEAVRNYYEEKDNLAKQRSLVRVSFANSNRTRARTYANQDREKKQNRDIQALEKKFESDQLEEDKAFVINQAIQLEKASNKLKSIPKKDWPNFVKDIKKTRKIWSDLGLDAKDCTSTDEELMEMTAKSNTIMERFKNPTNYFKIDEQKEKADLPVRGGFFKPCEYCHDLIPSDFFESHVEKCKLGGRRPVLDLGHLHSNITIKTVKPPEPLTPLQPSSALLLKPSPKPKKKSQL